MILQGKHTNGQQTYEKMFKITSYWENSNQNHNEKSSHTCYNGYYQHKKKEQVMEMIWRKGHTCALLVGM